MPDSTPEQEPSTPEPSEPTPKAISLAEFLESTPPNVEMSIPDLATKKTSQYGNWMEIREPDIQLHCSSDTCNGVRIFECTEGGGKITEDGKTVFISYRCRNCQDTTKVFSVLARINDRWSAQGLAVKFGELPTFGPHVPSRVISLIGPDREIFSRGEELVYRHQAEAP